MSSTIRDELILGVVEEIIGQGLRITDAESARGHPTDQDPRATSARLFFFGKRKAARSFVGR